ncbi:MAG TPA: hypothetical protein VE972_10785 [Conexibacter sp.]|nr:hypothetical protein [Conexibacter sp.]
MKRHPALDTVLSWCFLLTFPATMLAYLLGWPSTLRNALAIPLIVAVISSEIVDRDRWRHRLRRLRNRWRRT